MYNIQPEPLKNQLSKNQCVNWYGFEKPYIHKKTEPVTLKQVQLYIYRRYVYTFNRTKFAQII